MNNLIKQIVESKFNFNIDVEGNEDSLSKSKYNSKSLKEILELYNDVVDLDLPSGTLWCKYNLDVDPNLLTKAKDWYGGFYAWGELEGNKTDKDGEIDFSNFNYKHRFNVNTNFNANLTKYCNDPEYGFNSFTDNLTKLLPEDDAAYLNKKLHNYKFHIPTKELCEELIKYTNNYWVRNYDPNKLVHNSEDDGGIKGLNGRVFEENDKNLLFIPAAGRRDDIGFDDGEAVWMPFIHVGSECVLWTSNLYLNNFPVWAYYLNFSSKLIEVSKDDRHKGFNIRPVINL